MAVVTLPYRPSDGSPLNVVRLNEDLYNPAHPGTSLLGEANGNVSAGNLGSSFSVRRQHVRPEQFAAIGSEGLRPTQLFHGALFDRSTAWRNVGGATETWYQRTYASTVLVHYSAFATVWRMGDKGGKNYAAAVSAVQDGAAVGSSYRNLPVTVYEMDHLAGNEDFQINEHFNPRLVTGHFLMHGVTPGWHTVGIRVYIEKGQNIISCKRYNGKSFMVDLRYKVPTRIRLGIRNITVLRLA